jgi:hypothetical protein
MALDYPEGMECVWLASDQEGNLAVFITAGHGPIPKAALSEEHFDGVDDLLHALRPRTTAQVFLTDKNTADFEDLATLGLFVFDWKEAGPRDAYDLAAAPAEPLRVADLPANASGLAAMVRLPLSFRGAERVDPRPHTDCAEAAVR